MRPSLRTSLTALVFAVLALAAAGCGGSQVSADEVPGAPAALTVPTDNELGASDATSGDDASADADADSSSDDSAQHRRHRYRGRRHRRQRHDHPAGGRERRCGDARGDRRTRPVRRGGDAAARRVGSAAVRGLLRAERRRLLTGESPLLAADPGIKTGPVGADYHWQTLRPKAATTLTTTTSIPAHVAHAPLRRLSEAAISACAPDELLASFAVEAREALGIDDVEVSGGAPAPPAPSRHRAAHPVEAAPDELASPVTPRGARSCTCRRLAGESGRRLPEGRRGRRRRR